MSSNSELDQAGPFPSPFLPRGSRQVAAVDGGATGGVGHQHAIAKQLGQQRGKGLATAGAGAGELEQGFEELGAAHGGEIHPLAGRPRQALEPAQRLFLAGKVRRLVHHGDGPLALTVFIRSDPHRTGLHALTAAGAILRIELQGVATVGKPLAVTGTDWAASGALASQS